MFRGNRRSSSRFHPDSPETIVSTLIAAAAICFATNAPAFEPRPVPGRLIVKLRATAPTDGFVLQSGSITRTGIAALDDLQQRFEIARFAHVFPDEVALQKLGKAGAVSELTRFYSVDFAPTHHLETVRAAYAALDVVEIAEYDWMAPLHLQTNDSGSQWYVQSSSGFDAHITGGWNHSTGDAGIILAIADSGVDWQHPDLGGTGPDFIDGNIWINEAEYNGTAGVDDDGNGYTDDVRGWDFVNSFAGSTPVPGEDSFLADNDPMDFNGHGTHVAGIASAITNNGIGVSGVGFSCKVMALRIGGSILANDVEQGVVYMSYAAAAINYARNNGARAFNASWGSAPTSALNTAVDNATASGMVIVVSAGNDGGPNGDYLATRSEDDTFAVAATTTNDLRATFSNYGSWVDVAAPGVSIYSTYFDHNAAGDARHAYTFLQGTSMSAPLVTGLVGLVLARYPSFSRQSVQQLIQSGCDDLDARNPAYAGQLGAGRVNALKTFGDRFLTVPADYPSLQVALSQSAPGDTIALVGGAVYRDDVLLAREGRLIQGGWNASFTSQDPSNPTTIEGTGSTAAFEVVAGIGNSAIIEALRFTGGAAKTLTTPNGRYGGGVLCRDASPVFRDCVFESNTAGSTLEFGGGGGGFFQNSSALFERCRFTTNEARVGGALYALDSDLVLSDCIFDANQVHPAGDSKGAGVYVSGGTLAMLGGQITNGTQAGEGGALFASMGAIVQLDAVRVAHNSATRGGALALGAGSELVLRSSVIHANVASQLGGGIYSPGATATITNTSFDANVGAGPAIFAQSGTSEWTLHNCIVSNHAASPAVWVFDTSVVLDYNLYWNNTDGDVTGATMGAHALNADPLFVDQASGDLALGAHSPALDSGDPDSQYNDADGTRNDRGAFGGPAARSRAPSVPTDIAAMRANERNEISWTASPDGDVDFYAVYRSPNDANFAPAPANFVGFVPSIATIFTDPAPASSWYRVAAVDASGASSGFTQAAQALPTTGVEPREGEETPSAAPFQFALRSNVPNPFNPRTRIRFEIPQSSDVDVIILDTRGRLVRRLLSRRLSAGPAEVVWDGRDDRGRDVPSGTYVTRMVAGSWTSTRKMTLLR